MGLVELVEVEVLARLAREGEREEFLQDRVGVLEGERARGDEGLDDGQALGARRLAGLRERLVGERAAALPERDEEPLLLAELVQPVRPPVVVASLA